MKIKLREKIAIGLFWFILVTSFVFFAGLLQLKANGWELNTKTWKLFRTGIISLDGEPVKATVKINGQIKSNYLAYKAANLAPGDYDVEVSAYGYQPWHRTVTVEQGKVSLYKDIVLFYETPKDISPKLTEDFLEQEDERNRDLKVVNNEIYYQNTLVSRFSDPVSGAVVYPDLHHIIFMVNNEIRVVELDGANNQHLFNLSSVEPTILKISSNGRILYYLDQGKIMGMQIR